MIEAGACPASRQETDPTDGPHRRRSRQRPERSRHPGRRGGHLRRDGRRDRMAVEPLVVSSMAGARRFRRQARRHGSHEPSGAFRLRARAHDHQRPLEPREDRHQRPAGGRLDVPPRPRARKARPARRVSPGGARRLCARRLRGRMAPARESAEHALAARPGRPRRALDAPARVAEGPRSVGPGARRPHQLRRADREPAPDAARRTRPATSPGSSGSSS